MVKKIILRIFADKFVDMVRIESLKITFEILQLISEIDEFKGAWIVFFLKSLKSQKENLQIKISREQFLLSQMLNMGQTIIEHLQIRGRITLSELHLLTNFNKNTLKKHLENLVKNNQIRRNGVGRGVWYTLN